MGPLYGGTLCLRLSSMQRYIPSLSDYVLGRDDAIFNDISGLAQHKELIHRKRDITSDVYVMAGWIYDLVLQGRK